MRLRVAKKVRARGEIAMYIDSVSEPDGGITFRAPTRAIRLLYKISTYDKALARCWRWRRRHV